VREGLACAKMIARAHERGTAMTRFPDGRELPLLPLLLVLACLTGLGGCDLVEDHLRTCGSLRVDLTNSQQARLPVHLAAENESFSADTLLASGASRRIVLCVERGDRKAFRAMRDGDVIGATTCVVSKARQEYESSIARVIWAPGGFRCENW
jgi:hypothetical protein